jgi:hypothetical protein
VISTPLKETVDIDRVYKVFFYDNRGIWDVDRFVAPIIRWL